MTRCFLAVANNPPTDVRMRCAHCGKERDAGAPPFLLIHGDADKVVPMEQSTMLQHALEEHDVPVELIVKAGGGHPWPTLHEEVAVLADWFDRQLRK